MATYKEVIERARELIQIGWVRGYLHRRIRGKDCYCLSGALAQAAIDLNASSTVAQNARIRVLYTVREVGPGYPTIINYNDSGAGVGMKGKKNILAVLDRALNL